MSHISNPQPAANDLAAFLIRYSSLLLPLLLLAVLSTMQKEFRDPQNLLDIIEQSVPVAIVGLGMTFVLLTAGIDLAVGATMYIAVVAICGFMTETPVLLLAVTAGAAGAAVGAGHALVVNVFRVAPFIVTLATMFILRGACKRITQTKAIIAEESITQLERVSVFGIPLAIWILAALVGVSWLLLKHMAIGRQIYAVGENAEAAKKAGIRVGGVILVAYVICGAYAGLAGFVALTQQGAAQNTFGTGVEFAAVAAAVLGGTSLFGGRGNAWGAVFGAVFVSVVNSSLNFANADPYLYPLVTASLIFTAAAIDSLRNMLAAQRLRRRIRI